MCTLEAGRVGLQQIKGAPCVLCFIPLGLMRPRVVRTMLISACTLVFLGCGERGSYCIEKAGRLSSMVAGSQGKLQKWGLVYRQDIPCYDRTSEHGQ